MNIEWLEGEQAALRMGAFLLIFLVMSILEAWRPRRARRVSRRRRWSTNLAMIVSSAVLLRVFAPALAALVSSALEWGILQALCCPGWLGWVVVLVALDLSVYLQHVGFHRVPLLWRLHRVHHADPDLDASSGIRFHPLELVIAAIWRVVVVLLLGATPAQVFVFEILLSGMAMFNHANFKLPDPVDRLLRICFVTPDMHRVHHSVEWEEHESNFGFNLAVWDYLFRTYRKAPRKGQTGMVLGLPGITATAGSSLVTSLLMPFRSDLQGLPEDP